MALSRPGWQGFDEVRRGNYSGPVTTDWTSFLKEVSREALDHERAERLWREFRHLAAGSSRAHLERALDLSERLPPDARLLLAAVVAKLLEPQDWPPSWVPLRTALLRGLDNLLHQLDPRSAGSLANLLGCGKDESFIVGFAVLTDVRQILHLPCRRDEIPFVASLCSTGLWACLQSYRRALQQAPSTPDLQDARVAFIYAFSQYSDAARAMNGALEAAVFTHLDAPLVAG
ncbi:MAG TPA: hypothetical protein VH877_17110 [Polyangia bacterium]|nr:hypothetical protein [Polyangia bacterium]